MNTHTHTHTPSPLNAESRLFIDGALVDAEEGRTYDVINPATEAVAGMVAAASLVDADRALAAARRCFDTSDWSTNVPRRLRALTQFRDGLLAVADEWRRQIVAESGCPITFTHGPMLDSSVADINYSLSLLESYAFEREIEDLGSPMGGPARRLVCQEAAGVVVAITPWNAPVQTNLQKIIPALAAGCTVVLKAAHDTPWSATMLGRVASQCPDLPPGAFNVLTSTASGALGAMLTADPRVDVISFTGSTATGRRVMESASHTIKRTLLELGGKSAMVVLDDADFPQALAGAAYVCANAGQGCVLNTRLLVPRSRYDEAIAILESIYRQVPYGDPNDANNIMGPMINAAQRERVLAYIEKGKAEGARVVVGGGTPAHLTTGYYVEPTLFADVDNSMTIAQEEIFGPVLVVIPFDDDDDAIRIANDSIYGLSGSVISASPERALRVARSVRTGTMNVNGAFFFSPNAPFGGYKQSGIGREMGIEGFEEYLQTKTIAVPADFPLARNANRSA
ncbi:MAG TPA: aldehyde dehydrogenase [Gemmatimonas aurantiaca]|uniref:Aldehyde dehydrogenase n=2 Tax=Gemmatimonas aurantiaca TaxID=173480 RepID=C1AD47_GEMAT|nr:aldehyde dehydrogenase family protein [Gemmatimonas aurantiaca]BAH40424.1 aldehyde dehydrogenase [Gemmatimonas aurantiaca T-27]HCT56551.1 aldehyde dehydrogenase [Gemmatimonas aurantiaca]